MKALTNFLFSKTIGKFFCFLGLYVVLMVNSQAAGFVDVSALSVSPSPVTIGQNFDISFSLKEYQGDSKAFEYVEVWIQDQNRSDLYRVERWDNISFSAHQARNFSATTFLDPARRAPGDYFVIVRGQLTGGNPFNFGVVPGSNAANPYKFTAIIATGFVDLSGLQVSASPVTIGENFNIHFWLKEHHNGPKAFEYIEAWIQDKNEEDLYRVKRWDNIFFNAYSEQDFLATTFLDPARRAPRDYFVIVRGQLTGGNPFNFGVVPEPKNYAVNPYKISAISPIKADVVFSNYGPENSTSSNLAFAQIFS